MFYERAQIDGSWSCLEGAACGGTRLKADYERALEAGGFFEVLADAEGRAKMAEAFGPPPPRVAAVWFCRSRA